MPVYEERPRRINAIQWTGENLEEVQEFLDKEYLRVKDQFGTDSGKAKCEIGKDGWLKVKKQVVFCCAKSGDFLMQDDSNDCIVFIEEDFKWRFKEVDE